MTHVEKRLADVRHKITKVKENIDNHFRHPTQILIVLTRTEIELENYLFELKQKTIFPNRF